MAEYVDLPTKLPKKLEVIGIGRNVSIFDSLRRWSYSAVRDYWQPNGYTTWNSIVLAKAEKINTFPEPLPYSEIKGISKSVSKWVWQNMTPCGFQDYVTKTHTADIQRMRGIKSGQSRANKSNKCAFNAMKMKEDGMNNSQIAKSMGVHRNTVANWFCMHNESISA